jgi:PAS domain S-box-containing protein
MARATFETETGTILIVSGVPQEFGEMVSALENSGIRSLWLPAGSESLRPIANPVPDLVLLDEAMPGLDSLEVCRRFNADEITRNVPVVFMTAVCDIQHKIACFEAGGVDVIAKSWDIEEIVARVSVHIRLEMARKQLAQQNEELQRQRQALEAQVEQHAASLQAEIAERHQAERMLQNEGLLLKALLQAIPDPVWLKDPQGVYLAANTAVSHITGVPVAEMIGHSDYDYFGRELADFFRQRDLDVMAAGQTLMNEEWVPCPSEGKRLLETVKTPLRDISGEVIGVLGISREITERWRLQEALSAKEQYQRALLDNFPFIVWLKDTESRFLAVNRRFALAAGDGDSENFYGKTDLDIWPEELAARYRADDREVLLTGKQKHVEEHIVDRGVRKWFETFKAPVMHEGQLLGTVGFAREITERKRHEKLEKTRLLMLESLTAGAALGEVLGFLVTYVEETHPDFICSIMLIDQEGQHLRYGAASTSLPQAYLDAKDGIAIGPGVATCGAAAWSRERVVIDDVRTHAYWRPYRKVAALAGILSCWAEPVLDAHGNVLGVFGIYRREPGVPSADQLATINLACHQAAIVIERKSAEEALHKREQEFRTLAENSPDVVARLDEDCRYVYCNAQLEGIIGLPREQILGRRPLEIRDHPAIRLFEEKVREVLATGYEAEAIHVMDASHGPREIHDHVRFVPEFDQFGRIASVLLIGRYIGALKETERQLRTLIENIPDFVMRLDVEGHYLYVSPAVLRAFNQPQEYFLGRTAVDISFSGEPMSDQQMLDAVRKTADEGVPTMLTMSIVGQGETSRVFDLMYVPERDVLGRVVSVLGVARDITSLQDAHRALQKKEALLRSLIDSIPDLIFFKDRESRYLGFNKAFAEYCDCSEAQLIGRTDFDFAPPEVAEFYRQKDREMLASGQPRHNDEWITYPDGREVLLDTRKAPLYGADGSIIGVIGISRDITERRRIEEALLRREQEFRTLAENSPDMIIRYDTEWRHVYVNPAFEHTGIAPEQALGLTLQEVWQPLLPCMEFQARLEKVVTTGRGGHILLEWRRAGDELSSHHMQAVAEYDENGQVSGVLVIGHNVTELKATERRLEQSRAQLRAMTMHREEARENERKRIAREIHDELGQLLSVMRLGVTTLDYRFGERDPGIRDRTQGIVETIDRALEVIRGIASRLRPAALSAGIVPALEWQLQEFSGVTGIASMLHLPDGELVLDEEKALTIFRIAQESLTNILRHADADRVEFTLRRNSETYEFMVCDNGCGFDAAASATSDSYGILGMRERALMLGGNLHIESTSGQGTRLKLSIPAGASGLPAENTL